jgi:Putative Actinobacterial Holin-X, holin superfamily III
MNSEPPASSIVGLLRDLRAETSTLLQQEVELVKVEVTEKITELAGNAVQVGIGAFVAYAGAIILLLGLADLVGTILIRVGVDVDMATWISRALVGIVVALIGWSMIAKAKKAIAAQKIIPDKTLQSLQDSKEWVQDKIQSST